MIIIFIRRDLQGKPDDGISNRSMLGMDLSLKTSVNDDLRKEEDKSGFFKFHEDDDTEIFKVGKDKSDEDEDDDHCSNQSSTVHKDSNAIQKDHVESVKVEMGEIREENERLKSVLAQIVKNYQSLQTHFFDIVQQEQKEKSTENKPIIEEDTEPELVSLSLGTTLNKNKEVKTSNSNKEKADEEIKVGLSLALDSDFDASIQTTKETSVTHSTENSFEEIKEEEAGLQWPPSKALKTLKTSEEDASQQTHTKKARVSVRARCEAPTMHDGCQWRKYGQKISKGNPCPRAYYRCTVAPACPVRKQVQRCAEDMSILITTYEGTHNHPLPVSATAMASTTAAAANMLMSGSSTSRSLLGSSVTTTSITDLHGLNLNFSDNSRLTPFYPSNNTLISSSSFSSPTITLDLTSPPSLSSSSSQFNRFSPSFTSFPRYPSANFNFTSSSSTPQTKWNSNYLGYNTPSFHRNPIYPFARTSQDSFHQGYLQKNNVALPSPQQSLNETIAAATKVITSDPNFRSALASAITSIVGNGGSSVNQAIAENIVPSLKWGETLQSVPLYSTSTNVSGCASSFMTRSSSSNSQQSNLTILPSSLPFSSPKTTSPSSIQNRHHLN